MVREVGHRTARAMSVTHWLRDRICDVCGKAEAVRRDNPSTTCRSCASRRKHPPGSAPYNPKNRIPVSCAECGSSFERIPSDPTHQYCSRACLTKSARVERVCKECGASFGVGKGVVSGKTNSSANFCSRPCYNNWMCRTGRTTGRGSRWLKARTEALRRNPFCALCGRRRRLQVHHIIPFRLTRDNRQDNLVPVCGKHHKFVENIFLEIERVIGGDLETAKLVLGSQIRDRQDITRITLMEIGKRVGYPRNPSTGRAMAGEPPRRICAQPTQE